MSPSIISMHAVLISINCCGVLITGHPGVGKSSAALQLINNQHQLVADDCVEIIQHNQQLIGYAPKKLKNWLHIRGLGLIDIKKIYGEQSVIETSKIHLMIELSQQPATHIQMQTQQSTHNIHSLEIVKFILPSNLAINSGLAIETLVKMNYLTPQTERTYD